MPSTSSVIEILTMNFVYFKSQVLDYLVHYNGLNHKNVLLVGRHLNGHTLGFHPQT